MELLPEQPTFCKKNGSKSNFIEEFFQHICFNDKFVEKNINRSCFTFSNIESLKNTTKQMKWNVTTALLSYSLE